MRRVILYPDPATIMGLLLAVTARIVTMAVKCRMYLELWLKTYDAQYLTVGYIPLEETVGTS